MVRESSLIDSLAMIAVNLHPFSPVAGLLHGEQTVVYPDLGYQRVEKRGLERRAEMQGLEIDFRLVMCPRSR